MCVLLSWRSVYPHPLLIRLYCSETTIILKLVTWVASALGNIRVCFPNMTQSHTLTKQVAIIRTSINFCIITLVLIWFFKRVAHIWIAKSVFKDSGTSRQSSDTFWGIATSFLVKILKLDKREINIKLLVATENNAIRQTGRHTDNGYLWSTSKILSNGI